MSSNRSDSGNRGFGSMDKDKQRELSAKGGQTSHSGKSSPSTNSNTRGASSEQRTKTGRQSHKNS